MELLSHGNVIVLGFLVWLVIAPRVNSPQYRESFLAYMVTLLFCLIGSSEIMMIKPIAFFFTIGGVLAFCYVIMRSSIRLSIRK